MTKTIIAKELVKIGPTPDGTHCSLEFVSEDQAPHALHVPLDRVQALIGFLMQVERQRVEKQAPGQRWALRPEAVEASWAPRTQTVLLDFRVKKMRFPFAIPRDIAMQLMGFFKNSVPPGDSEPSH